MIPFRETRNYVMRITESLTLYKTLVVGKEIDHEFSEFLAVQLTFRSRHRVNKPAPR